MSWKLSGECKFKDASLEHIIKRLEKIYDVNIQLDNDLKNIRYTGAFSYSQRIDQVLAVINYDNQFHFRYNGNSIHISKKVTI